MLMFVVCLIMLVIFVIQRFARNTVDGWTILIVSIWAIGGLEMLSIGMIGEYIGKVYMETKERPRFIFIYRGISSRGGVIYV